MADSASVPNVYKSSGCHSLKCEFYVNEKKKVHSFLICHANFFMWTSGEWRGDFSTEFKPFTAAGPQAHCAAGVGLIFDKVYY